MYPNSQPSRYYCGARHSQGILSYVRTLRTHIIIIIIIKHAYAGTNDCCTHLRVLLVLQAPRHFGTRN
jgi:hypothetical protein